MNVLKASHLDPSKPLAHCRVTHFMIRRPLHYLATLSVGRMFLWFYFIWYLLVLVRYFDPNPRLWLTSLGLSVIIGAALLINTTRSGKRRVQLERWPTFRLFLTPFCVSSFAALVKGRNFFLIFSPRIGELLVACAICGVLWGMVFAARRWERRCASDKIPTPVEV